jgi:hypothetical protein
MPFLGSCGDPVQDHCARQRSRIKVIEERDANTRFFHLQACHRRRINFIPTIENDG